MEWGAMPVSIGLAGAYAAVMVGVDHYRTRQRVATTPAALTADLPAVHPAQAGVAGADPAADAVLEQSA